MDTATDSSDLNYLNTISISKHKLQSKIKSAQKLFIGSAAIILLFGLVFTMNVLN